MSSATARSTNRLTFNIPPCSCQLRRNSAADGLNCRPAIGLAENGRPGHEDRRPGGRDERRRRRIDAAIDLDLHPHPMFLDHLRYTTDLGHDRFDEFLTAKPRVD